MKAITLYHWSKKWPFFAKLNCFLFNCEISPKAKIGKKVRLCHNGRGLIIGGTTTIKDKSMIYPYCLFGNKNQGYPTIEENCKIYPKSIIIGDITIGKNSIIGAGTFVDKDIPPNSIVYNYKKLIIKKRNKIN